MIRFGSHLYFFEQRKTLQRVVAMQGGARGKRGSRDEVEERTRYLSTRGLVSDASWLIGGKRMPYFCELLPWGVIISMPAFKCPGGGGGEGRDYLRAGAKLIQERKLFFDIFASFLTQI